MPTPEATARWIQELMPAARAAWQWAIRPRVRLSLAGIGLLLTGGVFATSTVWTLPVLIAGTVMVAVAWIGPRLDGHFSVEWGDAGTQLHFRAQLKPAQPQQSALPAPAAGPEPEDAQVIEGEAHTVQIEVAELEALIAQVESGRRPAGP